MATPPHGKRPRAITRWAKALGRRVLRRKRRGLSAMILQVLIVGAALFLISGFARGPEPDDWAAQLIVWLRLATRGELSKGWVHPAIAAAVVEVLTFTFFFVCMLILAAVIHRIPGYVGAFVLAEFHHRQGHALSALELLMAISLPIAMMAALISKSMVSVFACIHFVLVYGYIRLSNDPARTNAILNWFIRIRTAVENPTTEHEPEEEPRDDVEDVTEDVDESLEEDAH
jgi:hypothetical protein